MKTLLLIVVSLLIAHASSYGWSSPGHEAIAIAAMDLLKGTPAETNVLTILDGEAPDAAAIWLDQIREGTVFSNTTAEAEAKAFRKDFPDSASWHFCNFIVGSTNYSVSSKYATGDDVVHALTNAIGVLEGAPSKMTKKQALRCILHLVGDIHQPLHCITGFYDVSDLSQPKMLSDVSDPATALQDRGGNQLMFTKTEDLHHFWDLTLPAAVPSNGGTLASAIEATPLSSQPVTPGDFHHWPKTWAGESMVQANAAYKGIVDDSATFLNGTQTSKNLQITIKLPGGESGYKADEVSRAQAQLTLAAVRLAQLLSSINYQ